MFSLARVFTSNFYTFPKEMQIFRPGGFCNQSGRDIEILYCALNKFLNVYYCSFCFLEKFYRSNDLFYEPWVSLTDDDDEYYEGSSFLSLQLQTIKTFP